MPQEKSYFHPFHSRYSHCECVCFLLTAVFKHLLKFQRLFFSNAQQVKQVRCGGSFLFAPPTVRTVKAKYVISLSVCLFLYLSSPLTHFQNFTTFPIPTLKCERTNERTFRISSSDRTWKKWALKKSHVRGGGRPRPG